MKKILAIVLVLVMVFATGCGADSIKFERGSVKDNVYTNKSADVTFTLPDGWVFSSEKDLQALMDASGEIVGEDVSKAAEITTVYDCMASSADGTANIIFMYENVAISGNADITEKKYADALIEGLLATGATTGLNYKAGDTTEMTIGGNTYTCGLLTVELGEGIAMEQRYLLRKLGDHMMSICITTFPGMSESSDDIIAKIS